MVLSLAFIISFIAAAVFLLVSILVFSQVVEAMEFTLPAVTTFTTQTIIPATFGFNTTCGGSAPTGFQCSPPTIKRFLTTSNSASTCPSGTTGSDGFTNQFKAANGTNGICSAPTFTYDITEIPNSADILSILFRITVNEVMSSGENSEIFEVTKDPATMTDAEGADTVFKRGGASDFSGTTYLDNDDFSTATGTGKIRTLSTTAETDLETALSGGQNFLTYAFNYEDSPNRHSTAKTVRYGNVPPSFPFDNPLVQINYTTTQININVIPFTAEEQRELDTFTNAQNIGFTVIGILPITLFFALFAILSPRLEWQ